MDKSCAHPSILCKPDTLVQNPNPAASQFVLYCLDDRIYHCYKIDFS